MKNILTGLIATLIIVSCTGTIQTIDAPYVGTGSFEREIIKLYGSFENYFISRFGSWENYLNIGYGNVPYK